LLCLRVRSQTPLADARARALQVQRTGVLDVHVEQDGREVPVRQVPGALLQWVLFHYMPLGMLAFFLALTAVLVFSFLAYHLYLTLSNTTTNEAWKRKELRRYLTDVALAEAAEAQAEAQAREGAAAPAAAAAVPPRRAAGGRCGRLRRLLRLRGSRAEADELTAMPPPAPLSAEALARIEAQCRNIYDRGPLQNMLEVLFPRSQRRDTIARAAAANKTD
jgi:hypothetical protein